MKNIFTKNFFGKAKRRMSFLFLLTFALAAATPANAQQQDCSVGSTASPILLETFGKGTNPGPALPAGVTNYTYVKTWPTDGQYTLWNNSDPQKKGAPFWYSSTDHSGIGTSDTTGYMMVVNAAIAKGEFYRKRITGLCQSTPFVCTVWAANVNTPAMEANYCPGGGGGCAYADILIKVENSTTKQVINSITTGKLPVEKNGLVWKQYNLLFSPQAGQNTVDLVFVNNGPGGNGNDLVLDDIAFKICLPNITIASPEVCLGDNITINGTLNAGFVNAEMQWQESTDGGPWTDIAGAKSIDLVVSKVTMPPPTKKYRLLAAEKGNVKEQHCRVISNEYSFKVNDLPTLSTVTEKNVLCKGGVGSATADGKGGLAPYQYEWNTTPKQTTTVATGLTAGTYTVKVTDKNKCVSNETVTITQPTFSLTAKTWASDAGCNIATGTGSVAPSGGTAPYSYSWNTTPVQTTPKATGLMSKNYTVRTTDANGCTYDTTVYVPVANGPSVTATAVNNPLCYGTGTGTASTAGTIGGAVPYTYQWSTTPVQTTANATGLAANITYIAIVTDANNCSSSATVKLTDPPQLFSSDIKATNVTCNLGTNGSATVSPTGGTLPYSYAWSTTPTQTNPEATGLSAVTVYTVTVTDANKCSSSSTVTLTHPTAIVVKPTMTGYSCAGVSVDGVATVSVDGGTPGYSYLWTPGNKTTPTVSNLSAGTYSITITDANGCVVTEAAVLLPSVKPTASFGSESFASCDGVMLKFTDKSSPSTISSWQWDFGDGKTSADQNAIHTFPYNSGIYSVTLTVSNPPCKDAFKTEIKITDVLDYIEFKSANIFTPNNDGINDCFTPALTGNGAAALKEECVELRVFDRWGVQMFESSPQKRCWDGINENNHQPVTDGMYFYVSRLKKHVVKGTVTLIRKAPPTPSDGGW